MPTWFMIRHGYPFRLWWHRHETPVEREARVSTSRKRFRDIYLQEVESWPDGREARAVRAIMDSIMDDVLGSQI